MNYYIITGTSRGLGETLATELLSNNNYIICVSRSKNYELITKAQKNNYNLEYIQYDLNEVNNIDKLVSSIFSYIDYDDVESISLINNAGVVNPIKPIDRCETNEVISNININAIAPILLVSKIIGKITMLNIEKRIINISSGAGKKPYYGWSCYCSAKAAIDMFTRCVAKEQEKRKYPVKILSLAPGIIDTDMQNEIRMSDSDDFELVDKFIEYKENGLLMSSEFVASKVIEILHNDNFLQGGVLDIRDLN